MVAYTCGFTKHRTKLMPPNGKVNSHLALCASSPPKKASWVATITRVVLGNQNNAQNIILCCSQFLRWKLSCGVYNTYISKRPEFRGKTEAILAILGMAIMDYRELSGTDLPTSFLNCFWACFQNHMRKTRAYFEISGLERNNMPKALLICKLSQCTGLKVAKCHHVKNLCWSDWS